MTYCSYWTTGDREVKLRCPHHAGNEFRRVNTRGCIDIKTDRKYGALGGLYFSIISRSTRSTPLPSREVNNLGNNATFEKWGGYTQGDAGIIIPEYSARENNG